MIKLKGISKELADKIADYLDKYDAPFSIMDAFPEHGIYDMEIKADTLRYTYSTLVKIHYIESAESSVITPDFIKIDSKDIYEVVIC